MNPSTQELGRWSFILGVVIAIVVGLLSANNESVLLISLLIILGFIVGILNVTTREKTDFLLAGVSLVIITQLGGPVLGAVAVIGPALQSVLAAILIFVLPATIIVAVRTIFEIERD